MVKATTFKEILDAVALDNAIIAGGAVRDWLIGRKPKDIDVFYQGNLNFDQLRARGFAVDPDQNDREIYEGLLGIKSITNYVFDKYKVQFIQISSSPLNFVNTFDLSTSYCWYDLEGMHFTDEFMESLDDQVVRIVKTINPERSMKRAEKVVQNNQFTFRKIENLVVDNLVWDADFAFFNDLVDNRAN